MKKFLEFWRAIGIGGIGCVPDPLSAHSYRHTPQFVLRSRSVQRGVWMDQSAAWSRRTRAMRASSPSRTWCACRLPSRSGWV